MAGKIIARVTREQTNFFCLLARNIFRASFDEDRKSMEDWVTSAWNKILTFTEVSNILVLSQWLCIYIINPNLYDKNNH